MTQPTTRLLRAAIVLGAVSLAGAANADTVSALQNFGKQAAVETKIAAVEKPAAPAAKAAKVEKKDKRGAAMQRGKASWYGPGFHGRRTANGERFDKNAMTAAHKTLPFGTKVRVVNERNGRSVVVRINDRGPYAHNRIIDLSHASAKEIGLDQAGIGQVTVAEL